MKWVFWPLVGILLIVRVPSLAEPAGGDQGLYAYVGRAIARGEVPYRDAWDQKPPAIHATYALMYEAWRNESVVALTDIVVAASVAWLLVLIGRRLSRQGWEGHAAALLFLAFGNPAFSRLGGVWLRAQCETFIALAVTAAVAAALRARSARRAGEDGAWLDPDIRGGWSALAGVLIGVGFLYKYNAAVYALPVMVVALVPATTRPRGGPGADALRRLSRAGWAAVAGFTIPVVTVLILFAAAGALPDLYRATVLYNLSYSGETYSGAVGALRYLVSMPVRQASLDGLWFLGGLGTFVLLANAVRTRVSIIAPAWVAAACLGIAVNGARGLPQYFVQASPALALAAGLAAGVVWRSIGPAARVLAALLLVVAVGRVSNLDKLVGNTAFDVAYLRGQTSGRDYLARFGGQRPTDKFSALATRDLADYLAARTSSADRILIFGFSAGAYVRSDRPSASRFFWSRPVLVGFGEGWPGYGASGLHADLTLAQPRYVVLQKRDWPAEGIDSATYFLGHAALAGWLRSNYREEAENGTFQIWVRQASSSLP